MRNLRLAAIAVVTALALAACGDAPPPADAPPADPAAPTTTDVPPAQ